MMMEKGRDSGCELQRAICNFGAFKDERRKGARDIAAGKERERETDEGAVKQCDIEKGQGKENCGEGKEKVIRGRIKRMTGRV